MKRSRIAIAKPQIVEFFEHQPHKVYTLPQLVTILENHREAWQLGTRMTVNRFASFLLEEANLSKHEFSFPSQRLPLYFWRDPSLYEVAMAFRPLAYLSHYSAMYYHNLTPEKDLHLVYVNEEQSDKPKKRGGLEQQRIDAAFKRPARVTNNCAAWGSRKVCLLCGKWTDRLGVVEENPPNEPVTVRVTNLERTLIDIVVRPAYAGGVHKVLEAYRRASSRVSVKTIAELLKQINHVYPYHQAIGFYLERSGCYDTKALAVFRKFPKKYDFYLDYCMERMSYSQEWRIYYPEDL